MAALVDFVGAKLAQLEALDQEVALTFAPYRSNMTGESLTFWGFYRPLQPVELEAWQLYGRRVGVMTIWSLADDSEDWFCDRALVRLPEGAAEPQGSAECAWFAHLVGPRDFVSLEPAMVERLRAPHRAAGGAL